jgi:threonine dehydrogenase-like Zn-dependent dehydrogenase
VRVAQPGKRDVVVIGCGAIGLPLAAALASHIGV